MSLHEICNSSCYSVSNMIDNSLLHDTYTGSTFPLFVTSRKVGYMAAKRTLREIKNQAALSAEALRIAKADPDPVQLQLRLLAAILQSEAYKALPQWRQAFMQGLCYGLALGRGVTAGVDVPLPAPAARPPNAPGAAAFEEEDFPEAPAAPVMSLAPEQIAQLQDLLARLQGPGAPPPATPPVITTKPQKRPVGARPRSVIRVDGHAVNRPMTAR